MPAVDDRDDPSTPAPRVVVCYADGQTYDVANDEPGHILRGMQAAGLDAELVDLADVRLADDGSLLVCDRATDELRPWSDPHAALMYHGAIAPANAMELLAEMQSRGTAVVNGPEAWPVFTDKDLFARYMTEVGVRVIPTTLVTTRGELRAAFAALGGEAVLKKPVSTEGDDIYVVRDAAMLELLADRLPELGGSLIAQPLVASTLDASVEPGVLAQLEPGELGRRHEFRINTARHVDGSISVDAVYMRVAPDASQIVNNVAQGARPAGVAFDDLHPADRRTVLDAAQLAPPTGDLIGWDLIGRAGERMIIEGNSGSGLPDGREGIEPAEFAATYGVHLRAAALASPLWRSRPEAQPGLLAATS